MKNNKSSNRTVLERNKFFATTSIAGFGLIHSSNSKAETAIWYIVIIIFLAFTIRNIIVLTLEYNNQQPIATVRMEKWNRQLENVIVELQIENFPFMYDEFYETNDSPYPYSYKRSLSYDLDQIITRLNSKEKLIGSNITWPHTIISLMTNYVSAINSIGREYRGYAPIRGFRSTRVYPFIRKFLDHCQQSDVTSKELIDKWFNQFMALVYYRRKYNPIPLHLEYVDVVAGQEVWLGIGIGAKIDLPFSMTFTIRYLNNVLLKSEVFGEKSTLNDAQHWKGEVSQDLNFYLGSDGAYSGAAFSIKNGHSIAREAKKVYSFQTQSENCSSITKYECINECLSKYVIDNCHCMPLLPTIESHDNLTPCSLENYDMCEKRPHCDNKCPEQCNQTVFSFDHIIFDYYYNETVKFSLDGPATLYPVFKEIYSISSMGYWASLGGVFDFWIGASVISAVHLAVYITKQLMYTSKKETKTGRNVRHMLKGLRKSRHNRNQMNNLLTLGITHNTKQTPEKVQEIEILAEPMELIKTDRKQQRREVDVQLENITQEIKKMGEQQEKSSQKINKLDEQQQKMGEQMEFLMKHFVKQEEQTKKISELVEEQKNTN